MEQEPDPIDFAVLDPTRDAARFEATAWRVAQRAIELRGLRRAVLRRGFVAFGVAMAAALLMWFTAPRREPAPTRSVTPAHSSGVLDWAMRDVEAGELFELGGSHAQ
jgi:hypothetical protein